MIYHKISDYIYDCNNCPTRCDSESKGVYIFVKDSTISENFEKEIQNKINESGKYKASKCEKSGYPDLEIKNIRDEIIEFLEVKVQQRTFMAVEKKLPDGYLKPSETVALNLSDLLRYFEIKKNTGINISIVWVLRNRLCLVKKDSEKLFIQSIGNLQWIYKKYLNKRRFRRKSGEGDIIGGVHKGVTVNYHFSLKELRKWEPGKYIPSEK